MDYRSRCSVMEACLPISEFKHQTVKLHVDMLNEIESLRAKLAEAEKYRQDAERYRLAKNGKRNGDVDIAICRVTWNLYNDNDAEYSILCEEEADEAIDAAIAKQKGE